MRASLAKLLLTVSLASACGATAWADEAPSSPPRVRIAAVPGYPDLAVIAKQAGTFRVRLRVGISGIPTKAELVEPPRLAVLKAAIEETALAWRFSAAPPEQYASGADRHVELQFLFKLLEPGVHDTDLLPRFVSPYAVEVRARTPQPDVLP
jgi:TonB family protein